MTDEVRRSGRATKGQHTKNIEDLEQSTPKRARKSGKAAAAKQAVVGTPPEEDEQDAIIRCICGYVEEDEDDERPMVMCDKCAAWQHNECMGISEDPDDLPDQYFCEQCKPSDHKELLAQIARGEKPWEQRAAERLAREAEGKKGRKRGRKGKKAKQNEVKPVGSNAVVADEPMPPPSPVQYTAPATVPVVEIDKKRKLPAELILTSAPEDQAPLTKMRKVASPKDVKPPPQRRNSSAVATTPVKHDSKDVILQTELVDNISELQSDIRKRAATALVKLFVESTHQALKQNTFKIPPGQTLEVLGLRLGLSVEYALYLNFWGLTGDPSPEYGNKLRMMLHNVKANPMLRDRLLTANLSPNDFSKMDSFDMASKELQEKTKEMMEEAEKQHMLVQEEGPRIRRTHKGDELVGDDSQHTTSAEAIYPHPPRRRESILAAPRQSSPEQLSPQTADRVELPPEVSYTEAPPTPSVTRPLALDTKISPVHANGAEPKTSSTFSIQNIWSSVDSPQSPDTNKQRAHQISQPSPRTTEQMPKGSGAQVDAEIDHLLKDEEAEEEEPYSPTDYELEPGTLWRGAISMPGVAEFRGTARFIAGADLSAVYSWNQLISPTLSIMGRIQVETATQYLCSLRFSKTTELSIIGITPGEIPGDEAEFNKLFEYFTDRERHGVVNAKTSPFPAVRDVYVVPLDSGVAKKPDFLELLDDVHLEEPRPSRMLLVAYVIKAKADSNNAMSSTHATPHHLDSTAVASPISAQTPFQNRNVLPAGNPGSHTSPITPYAGGSYGNSAQQQQQFTTTQHQLHPPPHYNNSSPVTGIEAARQVLGDMASLPAVGELLAAAPSTGIVEFGHIKEVFESIPASQKDFDMLVGLLSARMQQRPVGGDAGP